MGSLGLAAGRKQRQDVILISCVCMCVRVIARVCVCVCVCLCLRESDVISYILDLFDYLQSTPKKPQYFAVLWKQVYLCSLPPLFLSQQHI